MKRLQDVKNWEEMKNQVIWGDCLEGMKLIPDKSIDLILTDPPYGIGEDGRRDQSRVRITGKWANPKAKGYKAMGWDSKAPSKEIFDEMRRISKNQIIFGGQYFTEKLPQSNCWIFWDKKVSGDFSHGELIWTSFKTKVRKYEHLWSGFKQLEGLVENRQHPTQKPLRLIEWILRDYSQEGILVCDPFMGSWTTARACKNMGRDFIGFELEKDYCKVGEERLRQENLF